MSNPNLLHPDDQRLLAWADGELERDAQQEVRDHIETCAECWKRMGRLRAAAGEYSRYHGQILKPSLPPPPAAWKDLPRPLPARPRVSWRWAAVAAAALFAVIMWRVGTERTVSAAELLRKASAREAVEPARQRTIRVRTKRLDVTRPAVARTVPPPELQPLLEGLPFTWEDPLSARAFADWRNGLPEKTDTVRVIDSGSAWGPGTFYEVRTTTAHGSLAGATITLRAADMLAVSERLEFRGDEWLEVSEAVREPQADPPGPPPRIAQTPLESPPQSSPAAAGKAGPAEELRVIAILHRLGADLGEPVEVRRDPERGLVHVSLLGLTPEREQQIRSALAGLPDVQVGAEQPEALRSPAGPPRRPAARRTPQPNRELETRIGAGEVLENFVNDVLDHSDSALARTNALRNLARRFPPEVEAQLPAEDRSSLHEIVRAHLLALEKHTGRLRLLLRPLLGEISRAQRPGEWAAAVPALVENAQNLDNLLADYLAGTGEADPRRIAALLAALP